MYRDQFGEFVCGYWGTSVVLSSTTLHSFISFNPVPGIRYSRRPKSKTLTLLDSLKSSSKIAACGLVRHDVEG